MNSAAGFVFKRAIKSFVLPTLFYSKQKKIKTNKSKVWAPCKAEQYILAFIRADTESK